ncbi:MAG: DoxX family protein [Gammaproteobacteria bacterium]
MRHIYNAANMLGRIFLIALYVWSGISKISNFGFFEHYAASRGVPAFLLVASIVVELGGSLLLLAGYQVRIVALVLAGYSIIALLLFYGIHPSGLEAQIIAYAELADAGGFLVLVGSGGGGWTLDAVLGRRKSAAALPKA